MKKFETLGKRLTKGEQKNIMGGPNEGGHNCTCGCYNDVECGTMICSITASSVVCPGTTCYPRLCVPA